MLTICQERHTKETIISNLLVLKRSSQKNEGTREFTGLEGSQSQSRFAKQQKRLITNLPFRSQTLTFPLRVDLVRLEVSPDETLGFLGFLTTLLSVNCLELSLASLNHFFYLHLAPTRTADSMLSVGTTTHQLL